MKKLMLAILAAGSLALTPFPANAHGGYGYHGGYYGYHGGCYGGGFGFALATGLVIGSAFASPWYYNGYCGPNYGYYGYYGGAPYYRYSYYTPPYDYYSAPGYQPAPAVAQPAPAPAQQQPTTVINNYYYNSSPMSGANSLFGR